MIFYKGLLWKLSILFVFGVIVLYLTIQSGIVERRAFSVHSGSQGQGNGPFDNNKLVVIYNRIPKTGSTTFMGVAYDLCKVNGFNAIHVNVSKNSHMLSISGQLDLVKNISLWEEKKPAIYHGHISYINFQKFGFKAQPIYINIVREPLERFISYFYFLRYGDDFRPHLTRRKKGDKMTFDDCVAKGKEECNPDNLWLQVPYFCGQHAECLLPGSKWALERAKSNLVSQYLIVGITEDIRTFISMMESSLPIMFKGATKLFDKGAKSHLRKTAKKISPSKETLSTIQQSKVYQMERDFYEFAQAEFEHQKKVYLRFQQLQKMFHYEKIKPNKP